MINVHHASQRPLAHLRGEKELHYIVVRPVSDQLSVHLDDPIAEDQP
jgi:hypothetical protein